MHTEPVRTFYLELRTPPPPSRAAAPIDEALELERWTAPTLDEYRALYTAVGAPWRWVDRLLMSDADLAATLRHPRVELWLLKVAGAVAGYAELDRRMPGEVELVYFGLKPEFTGRGRGRTFLQAVLEAAWTEAPQRVWLHTCAWDHPAALPLYRRLGFQPYDEQVIQQRVPDATPARRHRFVRPAQVWLPTWRGTLLLAGMALALAFGVVRTAHPFLAVHRPVPANVLVVEGWTTDSAVAEAARLFAAEHYDYLVASGGPLPKGDLALGHGTYAGLAVRHLEGLGFPRDRLIEAAAPPSYRNRTHRSAESVRAALEAKGLQVRGLNVLSQGTHARRTWVVYRKVLGATAPVGVVNVPPLDYDPARWWASSEGVKSVLIEGVGWLYETLWNGGR